jgi:hypothetical protein
MAKIITNEPIEIINPVQIGTSQLQAQRIPLGEPGFYKPSISLLDDGELLLTVAGPRQYVYSDRPPELQKHIEHAFLYRSTDGGITWSQPQQLPAHSSREAHLTILKNGTIIMNAHCVQKQQTNPQHYGHTVLHRSEDRGKTWETKDILMRDMPGAKTTVDIKGCRDKVDAINAGRDIIEFDDGDYYYRSWGPGRVKEGLDPIGDRKSIRVRALLEIGDCTYIPGPWVELPLVTEDNLHDCDIGQMIGGSHNVLELDDGTVLCAITTREGYERIWISKDSGKTWDKNTIATFEGFTLKDPQLYWCGLFQEAFLFKGDTDKIYAILRVDDRYFPPEPGEKRPEGNHEDQSDCMHIFQSSDQGKTWTNRKSLGTYGEMYPSIIKLQDSRLLLTYTVRNWNPSLGVRAVLGYEDEDGLHFDLETDRIVLEDKTAEGEYSGGGFGNTVQLADGTLVTPYTYMDKNKQASGNDLAGSRLELVRWELPPIAN